MSARLIVAIGWALSVIAASGRAQMFTENAGVVSPEIPTFATTWATTVFDDLVDHRIVPSIALGLDRATEVKVLGPMILNRRARFVGAGGQRERADWLGVGDPIVRLKRSISQADDVMSSTRFAALAEVTIPAGRDSLRSGGVRIPRRLQSSPGAFQFGAGLAATVIRDRHRFAADAWVRHALRHEGIRLGPSIEAGVAYWYRLHPATFDPERPSVEVRPLLELRYLHQFSSVANRRIGDDGDRWILAPGIQVYPSPSVLLEASARIPMAQTIDDPRGDFRWGASFAVKILF